MRFHGVHITIIIVTNFFIVVVRNTFLRTAHVTPQTPSKKRKTKICFMSLVLHKTYELKSINILCNRRVIIKRLIVSIYSEHDTLLFYSYSTK